MTKNLERSHPPQLTLVGAGPGAIDLITVRGLNALKSANVVLYDALVDKELLDFAPQATHIFVGKRKGFKRYSQEEINEMIVSYALTHGHVVRLKGGDSFIFGRGAEEIEFCRLFNLKIDVIPGISSSLAAPALAGISVTQRNLARSFWVLTGTASEGKLNNDIKLAAQSSATVVILMGMSKLPQIVEIFKNQDKENLPVSIIQNATKSTIVSKEFHAELIKLAEGKKVKLVLKSYDHSDLSCKQIVITATDDLEVNKEVYRDCKQKNILVNVADTPQFCDFYMGGIVTKGNVKIAISTNGKSPTLAKRLRQYFEAVIPENMNDLLENLRHLRSNIKGGFEEKVRVLNDYTASLIEKPRL